MSAVSRARTRRRLTAVVFAAVLALGACSDGQDPGLDPGLGGDQPGTTSNTLGQCPAGGPDATTPPAGCIGPNGQVLRP